jgi:hypothetical protein
MQKLPCLPQFLFLENSKLYILADLPTRIFTRFPFQRIPKNTERASPKFGAKLDEI